VLEIHDEIELTIGTAPPDDIRYSIEQAFERHAKLDADELSVEIGDAMVTLSGNVGSWSEHDATVRAAWAAPGVAEVRDHIRVGSAS
jgi:osmotically-inducible protein OsmY